MYFLYIVYTVVYYSILTFNFAYCKKGPKPIPLDAPIEETKTQEEQEESTPSAITESVEELDLYTFIALLEIIFTDNTKKSCTGAIIHEKVVITAGHCFTIEDIPWVLPELTASFVIIGSRLMFESGYEQYLPIEKVITHPQFKGWTADLALVYTFALMTSDKPGQVIPLAGERSLTPVDSNVTVLSWGFCTTCKVEENTSPHSEVASENSDCSDDEKKQVKNRAPTEGTDDFEGMLRSPHNSDRKHILKKNIRHRKGKRHQSLFRHELLPISESNLQYELKESLMREPKKKHKRNQQYSKMRTPNRYIPMLYPTPKRKIKKNSKYLSSNEFVRSFKLKAAINSDEKTYANLTKKLLKKVPTNVRRRRRSTRKASEPDFAAYRNWRRLMGGTLEQNLTVEVFNFVNVQTCKKLIEKVKPSTYSIKNNNEILCYSSDAHFITNEDAGAPAIQQKNLVAVTIGGVEFDGDHVAIGMKMSCFCPWIAQNLPDDDGEELTCCVDCCGTEHFEKTTTQQIKTHYPKKPIGRHGYQYPNRYKYFGLQRFKGDEEIEDDPDPGPDPNLKSEYQDDTYENK